MSCYLCGSTDFVVKREVNQKPERETDYGITADKYHRSICECQNCGVYFNLHEDLIPDDFYEGQYNQSIIMGNLTRRFNKIISFPFTQSDNKNRCLRIVDYLYQNDRVLANADILDVGTGTGVYLHEMMKFGCNAYCIDPDPMSTQHAIENIGIKGAFTGTFESMELKQKFDLISFNKVLEHVKDPVLALKKSAQYLNEKGYIYVELPDGSRSIDKDPINRSEFFVEHYTTFNEPSFRHLATAAGLHVEALHQVIDPSGKHTIYGFLTKNI